MKKKIILTSVMVIVLCLCVIAGSTFALFTKETEVSIAVTAGKLDVTAVIDDDNAQFRSLGESFKTKDELASVRATHFANGGGAEFTDGTLTLSRITPGDAVAFDVKVTNTGDVAVQYTVKHEIKFVDDAGNVVTVEDENGNPLPNMIRVSVTPKGSQNAFVGSNTYVALGGPNSTADFTVVVEFPNGQPEYDNYYQGLKMSVNFTVETVQANGVNSDGTLITP